MRIPDETSYKEGEKHIEEIKGWVLCTHCLNSPLTHLNQINTNGYFYCDYLKKWKHGDDVVEYKCEGYELKTCKTCIGRYNCLKKSKIFCNSYRKYPAEVYHKRFTGRKRITNITSQTALDVEEKYYELLEQRAKDGKTNN